MRNFEGVYLFMKGGDVGVLSGRCPRLREVLFEVREDLVVGEDGGLGFKNLHSAFARKVVVWVRMCGV